MIHTYSALFVLILFFTRSLSAMDGSGKAAMVPTDLKPLSAIDILLSEANSPCAAFVAACACMKLPPEMWGYIFKYADSESLDRAINSCKKFGILATYEKKIRSRLLIEAVKNGNILLVKALLDQGAQVNGSNEYRETALHWAVRENHLEVAKLLLGVPCIIVDAEDIYHRTPLHYCVPFPSDFSPAHKQDISSLTNQTHARTAVFKSNRDMISLLVQADVNLNVKAYDNKTFLELIKTFVILSKEWGPNDIEHPLVKIMKKKGFYSPKEFYLQEEVRSKKIAFEAWG